MSTTIEWAQNADGTRGETWNPIRARNLLTGKTGTFCTKISPGCAHCYAETHNLRMLPHGSAGLKYSAQNETYVEISVDPKMLTAPLARKKPTTHFVCSMTDLFHHLHDFRMIAALFGIMALAKRHTFIVLTKRPERALEFFRWLALNPLLTGDRDADPATYERLECGPALTCIKCAASFTDDFLVSFISLYSGSGHKRPAWPLANVILGTSVEDQETADRRIPQLLACPAACRLISAEPLLAPVDLRRVGTGAVRIDSLTGGWAVPATDDAHRQTPRIGWVIGGAESGHGARPMHPDWARSLRDQCVAASVPYFFKQWGEFAYMEFPPPPGLPASPNGYTPVGRTPDHRWDKDGRHEVAAFRVGKHASGRLLDGVEWSQIPDLGSDR